jgi:hypothetical protein
MIVILGIAQAMRPTAMTTNSKVCRFSDTGLELRKIAIARANGREIHKTHRKQVFQRTRRSAKWLNSVATASPVPKIGKKGVPDTL